MTRSDDKSESQELRRWRILVHHDRKGHEDCCSVRMKDGASESIMDDPTTPRYAMSGFHIEMGGFQYAAAIDARHRTSQRRHDMAAGATLNNL
ncbi:MAG: hypothetical protein J6T22_13565 [Bacteroidales bacterium]|nr:hypothetical protein [Bacteroidales bacterium]MBO7618216.1 hypothetical protein [Bacteroidales bacterium]